MTGAVGSPSVGVARPRALGELPRIAFLAALGLLIVAIGDTLARLDVSVAPLVWWLGLLLIVTPVAARLIGREAERRERLAMVLVVGLALYGVKILGAPSSFLMLDEFLHWVTLDDMVVTGRLFTPNNVLLASPYYPGLEIASDLLVRTGFSTWEAGTLVVGVGRVLLSCWPYSCCTSEPVVIAAWPASASWSTPPTRVSCSSTPSSRMSLWRCRSRCSRCGASSGVRSPRARPCRQPGPADEVR